MVGAYDTRAGPAGVQLCMYSSVTDYCSVFGRSATKYNVHERRFCVLQYSESSFEEMLTCAHMLYSSLGTHYADYGSYAQYGKELLPAQSCAHTSMLNVLVSV